MTEEVKQAQAMKFLQDRLKQPAYLDAVRIIAQDKFLRFKAYLAAGFDAQQALELVIREGTR